MEVRDSGQAHPGWIKGTPRDPRAAELPTCWGAHPRGQGSHESPSPQHHPAPCLTPWGGGWVSNPTQTVFLEFLKESLRDLGGNLLLAILAI